MKDAFDYIDPMDEIYAIRRKRSQMFEHDIKRIVQAACDRMHRDLQTGMRTYAHLPIVRRAPRVV